MGFLVLGHRMPKDEVVGADGDESREESKGGLSTSGTLGLEYWEALRTRLIEGGSPMRPHKPSPQHWTNFAVGRSGFHLSAAFVRTRREIGV